MVTANDKRRRFPRRPTLRLRIDWRGIGFLITAACGQGGGIYFGARAGQDKVVEELSQLRVAVEHAVQEQGKFGERLNYLEINHERRIQTLEHEQDRRRN